MVNLTDQIDTQIIMKVKQSGRQSVRRLIIFRGTCTPAILFWAYSYAGLSNFRRFGQIFWRIIRPLRQLTEALDGRAVLFAVAELLVSSAMRALKMSPVLTFSEYFSYHLPYKIFNYPRSINILSHQLSTQVRPNLSLGFSALPPVA